MPAFGESLKNLRLIVDCIYLSAIRWYTKQTAFVIPGPTEKTERYSFSKTHWLSQCKWLFGSYFLFMTTSI